MLDNSYWETEKISEFNLLNPNYFCSAPAQAYASMGKRSSVKELRRDYARLRYD